jgi:hypothetical protein
VQERYLGRMEPDMDVCDMNGDKVGTVAHVYRHEMSTVTAGSTTEGSPAATASAPETSMDDFIEVKTGFLGLGKHLYVPTREIKEVTQGCVFLGQAKDDLESLGWTTKPAHLDQLT